MENRIRDKRFLNKIVTASEAATMIEDGMTVATSGFTPSGYPKMIPNELAKRAENGEKIGITLITGASAGDELDGTLTRSGVIKRRFPYQTHKDIRNKINDGTIKYQDMHLSHVSQFMDYGFFGKIDVAIIEAVAITEEGGIIPSTSVGISPQALKLADEVMIEINTSQPIELEGVHDIYMTKEPPFREAIPITKTGDRIGKTYMEVDFDKVVAIVKSDITDKVRPLGKIDENSKKISNNIIEFLKDEVSKGRLPENLLPLQSGVGSVANAVLGGLVDSDFENLTCYTEVIQDSMLDLIDIYGHVNSTNIMGSRIMNGIGGSGDFTRNGYMSIFTTESIAKNGDISSIVPMVSHVDHTEHDVEVVVTEQGLADLRGLSPIERARKIIENCAHPMYKEKLKKYLDDSIETSKFKHEPHMIGEALNWHANFLKTGSMK